MPLSVLAATLLAGAIFKRVLSGALRRWSARSTGNLAKILPPLIDAYFMIWVLLLGLHLALQSLVLPDRPAELISKSLLLLWLVSLTFACARLASSLVRTYGAQIPGALQVTTLTQNLAQLFVVGIGVLAILRLFGISIAPMLTALGVGGLAVALALQDTLSNLFAGFYVSIAGQIRLGDYIRLSSGEEGYVADISWRSTTLRALSNNWIIVPNNKLAQAIITNFDLPVSRIGVPITVTVGYREDPHRLERVLLDEAQKATREVPGMLPEPGPTVRLIPGFTDAGFTLTVACQVAQFSDQFVAQHELRKRIFDRLRAEGIELFPDRTVYVERQDGGAAQQ